VCCDTWSVRRWVISDAHERLNATIEQAPRKKRARAATSARMAMSGRLFSGERRCLARQDYWRGRTSCQSGFHFWPTRCYGVSVVELRDGGGAQLWVDERGDDHGGAVGVAGEHGAPAEDNRQRARRRGCRDRHVAGEHGAPAEDNLLFHTRSPLAVHLAGCLGTPAALPSLRSLMSFNPWLLGHAGPPLTDSSCVRPTRAGVRRSCGGWDPSPSLSSKRGGESDACPPAARHFVSPFPRRERGRGVRFCRLRHLPGNSCVHPTRAAPLTRPHPSSMLRIVETEGRSPRPSAPIRPYSPCPGLFLPTHLSWIGRGEESQRP